MADDPQTQEQTTSTSGNGNGLAGALSEMMKPLNALLKNIAHRLDTIERTVMEDHRPRIVRVENGVAELQQGHAAIQGHLADQDTRTEAYNETWTQQLGEMRQAVDEANKANRLYQSQIGSLDKHRKEHAAEIEGKVDQALAIVAELKAQEDARQARLKEIATRQEAARKAAVTAVAVQQQTRKEQLGMAWRFMALILPILLNYGVNATTLPHPVKNGVAVVMLLIVAGTIVFTAWTWLRPPTPPPLIDPLTGRPFPPPSDGEL